MQNKVRQDYEKVVKRQYETALAEASIKLDRLEEANLSPEKYEKTYTAIMANARRLNRKYRNIKSDYIMKPIDKDDNQMRISDFIEAVKSGDFTDYDGFGVYATRIKKTDIPVYPSDVSHGLRTDFTHIVWYNR